MQHGFTSLELLTVCGIILSISMISLPTLRSISRSMQVREETWRLGEAFDLVHIEAPLAEQSRVIRFGERDYTVLSASEPQRVLRQRRLPASVRLDHARPFPVEHRSSPSGAVSPFSIGLVADRHRCDFSISLRGRVRLVCG